MKHGVRKRADKQVPPSYLREKNTV